MEKIDIWRSSNKLIEPYGDEAMDMAVRRAEHLLAEGDNVGASVMTRVAEAIDILQRENSGEQVVH